MHSERFKIANNLWAPFLLAFVVSTGVQAADFYVDGANAAASDSNSGTAASPWKTISKANQTLSAGDTVLIKQGSYQSFIAPVRSGTAASPITYRNYANDLVTIQNTTYGVHLDGKSRIIVQGIICTNLDRMMIIENSAHSNQVVNCKFQHMRNMSTWSGSRIWMQSTHNVVRNCIFSDWGQCSGGSDDGAVLEIGFDSGDASYSGDYNLIENCTIYNGAHHTLGVNGNHNIVRSNYTYNANWTAGKGNRTIYLNGYASYCTNNLIEHNRIGYTDVPCDSWGAPGIQVSTSHNIIRFNEFFFNNLGAIQLSTTDNYDSGPNWNSIYNNTFFRNGWQLDGGSDDQQRGQITFNNWSSKFTVKGNRIKNNLYLEAPRVYGYNTALASDQQFANNYNADVSGNPLFLNATSTLGNAADATYPNLAVRTNSPVVNAGGSLTTISSPSGSGTSFVVADPAYFVDGWGIVPGDTIQLLGSAQTARITSINPATRAISLSSSLTWTSGQGIAMAYAGTAPDIGAFETGAGATTSTNAAPIVTIVASQTIGFPTNVVALSAHASDPNGDALAFTFSQVSGPSSASFSATNTTNTTATVSARGIYVFRFTASDSQVASFSDTMVTFAPDPETIAFEAESGTLVAPFVAQNGSVVQNSLTGVANGGRASYVFSILQAGAYVVTALVNAPDDSANSFFVNIDAEPTDPAMTWDIPVTSGFEARTVSWRGTSPPDAPKEFALTAGTHTLIIRGREAGVLLDRIEITDAGSASKPAPATNLRVVSSSP
jgi:hypothetical protein